LARASKVQRRVAGSGFEWRTEEAAVAKLREEVEELASASPGGAERKIGDVLFATVAIARRIGVDPEGALRRTIDRFAGRYERMLALAKERDVDLGSLADDGFLELLRESLEDDG
jgi:uncharacterized protein YabN with tetrapyrrole methylase and pyrophosphatase domain